MYGGGENVIFNVKPLALKSLVYTPEFKVAEITLGDKTHRCILKDLQVHPVTDSILHVDFLRLIEGTPVKLEIPVRCVGASPGVKVGGKLQQKMRRVKVKTTPEKMVDELEVSINELLLGESVRVRDIKLPEGIEIMNPPANPVASIEIPRALRSAEAKEAAKAAQ
jgi:large subunit ribosomal protein L25